MARHSLGLAWRCFPRRRIALLVLNIGENDQDPVLTITDLLPHLGAEQMSRKSTELIKGEELNVLVGGLPYPDPELAGRFKLNLLQLLNEQYGLVEKDLVTAEIEIVPAGKARDVGLDRSMIGAYGQDDRACAFPALAALTDLEKPERTSVCMFLTKRKPVVTAIQVLNQDLMKMCCSNSSFCKNPMPT